MGVLDVDAIMLGDSPELMTGLGFVIDELDVSGEFLHFEPIIGIGGFDPGEQSLLGLRRSFGSLSPLVRSVVFDLLERTRQRHSAIHRGIGELPSVQRLREQGIYLFCGRPSLHGGL